MTLGEFRELTKDLPDDLPMVRSAGAFDWGPCNVVLNQTLRRHEGPYGELRFGVGRDYKSMPLVQVLIVI